MSAWQRFIAWCRSVIRWPQDPRLRRRRIIIIGVVVAIVGGTTAAWYTQRNNVPTPTDQNLNVDSTAIEQQLTGQLVTSPLDGKEYAADLANRRPIGVMVENHPDARPQYGLSRASVIYEAVAEGGITRYLLVFGPTDADRVGPIRSARTYYIDWALEYDAMYAHAGGAANALAKIRSDKTINDMDMLGKPVMWRQRRGNEASEHTLYGSTVFMRSYSQDVGWSQTANFIPWQFTTDTRTPEERQAAATASAITIPYGGSYTVSYAYDPTTNTYARTLAKKADMDALTNEQIAPTNIVVQVMERNEIESGGKTVGDMTLYGKGKALIFSGGTITEGEWRKEKERSRTKFYDAAGTEVSLRAGQTIVTVIQPTIYSKVSYQ